MTDFLSEFRHNSMRVLDIRGEKEAAPFKEKYNGRWFNLPQDQLRRRVAEIPVDEEFYLLCDTGPRSYEAQVFLTSRGIDKTRNIQGGYAMIKVTDPEMASSEPLRLKELVSGIGRKRIVLFGYFPRAELPPEKDFFQEAGRYLG